LGSKRNDLRGALPYLTEMTLLAVFQSSPILGHRQEENNRELSLFIAPHWIAVFIP